MRLEQTIFDHTGHHDDVPHPCWKAEVLPDGRLFLSIVDTNAGRTAAAMLRDDLLDAVHWKSTVWLRVLDGGSGELACSTKDTIGPDAVGG